MLVITHNRQLITFHRSPLQDTSDGTTHEVSHEGDTKEIPHRDNLRRDRSGTKASRSPHSQDRVEIRNGSHPRQSESRLS